MAAIGNKKRFPGLHGAGQGSHIDSFLPIKATYKRNKKYLSSNG
jgi:hypothetical protein